MKCIRNIDEAIGSISKHAHATLGEDLVIVVSSDNGASVWEGGLNSPLRSGKFSPFEGILLLVFLFFWTNIFDILGGVRVPAFAIDYTSDGRYFGPGGRSYDGLAHLADWMPTLLSLAGMCLLGRIICYKFSCSKLWFRDIYE